MLSTLLKNKKMTTFVISIGVPLIVTLLLLGGFLNTWESKISDAFYLPSTTLDDIVIVAIDDKSLQELGRWPWSRSYFGEAIDNMNKSSVIGIDISFFEPAEGDDQFAASIKNNTVVLAMEITNFSSNHNELYAVDVLKPTETLGIEEIDYSTGYVNLFTDSDGVTRSFAPSIHGNKELNHFSLVIVQQVTGVTPVLDQSKMLIHFYSQPGGYTTISFTDVYHDKIDPSYFQNKIVLIGATAPNLHDDAIVPISNQAMSGVEINTNLVQSILLRDYIYHQDTLSTIILIFLFGILASIVLYTYKIHIATILISIIGFSYILLSIQIFEMGILMNIIFPLFSLSSVYFVLLAFYYTTEEKNRKWITTIFGKYVSPIVIENLIKNPNLINLGGEKRDITIFFSDIRGFTTISEKLSPERLVQLLNEYLTEMTSIIIDNEGLVDKYMGDAIMAFWGAPMNQPNHAYIACESSLKMIKKLKELQQTWEQKNIPSLNIGIGLNTGPAIVGNMGSEKRLDYTAMGDNVNLGSRLEGLNKTYGTHIIISEYTYQEVKDTFICRKLDLVKVKGMEKAIHIFELITKKDEVTDSQLKFIQYYETGLMHYLKQQWNKAILSFKKAQQINGNDPATALLLTRCQKLQKNPPPNTWNGVWKMKSK